MTTEGSRSERKGEGHELGQATWFPPGRCHGLTDYVIIISNSNLGNLGII